MTDSNCVTDGASVHLARGKHRIIPRGSTHQLQSIGADSAEVLLSYSSSERAFRLAQSR
jgi:hypothetical protein